jgi:hypothetical protein
MAGVCRLRAAQHRMEPEEDVMTLRHEAAATCLSWIPPTAVHGMFGLPFGLGIAHYDQPPPDDLPDVEALLADDAIRFANQLHAWIEVEEGR